jgi:hypothetical protein
MATGDAPAVTKTAFVAEQLRRDPSLTLDAINRAWTRAGHDGGISGSTYFKIKAQLGAEGATRSIEANRLNGLAGIQAAAPAPALGGHARHGAGEHGGDGPEGADDTPVAPEETRDRAKALDGLEAALDDAIFTCMGLGGLEEAIGHIRAARRAVIRSGVAAEVAG